jgi:hypothetical protein
MCLEASYKKNMKSLNRILKVTCPDPDPELDPDPDLDPLVRGADPQH